MPVYVTSSNPDRRRFHRSEDCEQLRKKPSTGRKQQVLTVELEDLARPIPCLRCYPDAPRPVAAHRYCYECDLGRVKPCAHNGGVPVFQTRVHRKETIYSEAGETYYQQRYVWPEQVRLYITT